MTDPLGPVVITAREIYDQLVRVADALATLTTRIDRVAERHDETKRDVDDHEARLRSLERSRWPLPSLAAVVSLAALGLSVVMLLRR